MATEKKVKTGSSLHTGFMMRVLAPPIIVLLVLAAAGLWQLDRLLRHQALDNLRRSAVTTAAKIEREFALRKTVVQRTGEEIFAIKHNYRSSRQELDQDREQCRAFVRSHRTMSGAPGGVCEPFLTASGGGALLAGIEDAYVRQGSVLIAEQDRQLNTRLSAFKQIFPEAVAFVVVDKDKQVVSSAISEGFQASVESLQSDAAEAIGRPVPAKVRSMQGLELTISAYPIAGGAVLAAYDMNNKNFIRQIWESAPIDRSRSLAVILEANGAPVYPRLEDQAGFIQHNEALRRKPSADIMIGDVPHTTVAATAGESDWLAAVAAPTAVVLSPARDSRLIGIAVIGLIIVGYSWLGTYFIRRTLQSVSSLVSGALIFASGRLDYKIALTGAASEFTLLADTMNTMAWRIADAQKEIDKRNKEFISIATHELRTPLTAILGNLSMAVDEFGDKLHGPVKPLVTQAHDGTLRLRDLVNDMLDMARLEGGRVEFVIERQDIRQILQETLDALRITADAQKIRLEYDAAHAAPVMADQAKLRIVANNFVSNAIKYNRPEGSVRVFHEEREGVLVTAVADTGLGIPEEQQAHMFEKFFRVVHADRQNVTGTGLGMYITQRYVLGMGGRVWFESEHGKGTTFYFSLPLAVTPSKPKTLHHKLKQHRVPKPRAAL